MRTRLKLLLFLFLCLSKYVIFGKADNKQKKIERIVIFQGAKLGDMVCTTPMFREFKKRYPKCHLTVIGNAINKQLLDYNRDVDDYIVFKSEAYFSLINKLRKKDIDFACITGPNFLNLATLYLSGVPLISAPTIRNGFSPHETRTYKILNKFVISKEHRMEHYVPGEYLKLLEPIDIFTKNTKKHLGYSKGAEGKILKFFDNNDINIKSDLIVGISPSAGNKIKNWGGKKFAELADYIYKEYSAKIIVIGGERDKEEVDEMISSLNKDTKIINTLGAFSIDELKAIISKMNIFIAVDTGPIYIAEAFDVATVDIVGPVDEREQPPVGERHKIVKIEDRIPEVHIMNARMYDKKEARRQTDEISVNMVIEKFNELVK